MTALRQRVPAPLQRVGRQAYVETGRLVPGLQRVQPQFLLIGGQRCGTTSLFRALMQHPRVIRPSFHKGINYFDVSYHRGPEWYAAHFPLQRRAEASTAPESPVAFEASGYYMFHPWAAERIAADLPDIKLVALLRDPVERAYSAWKHEHARGFETASFEDALELEDERVRPEVTRMRKDPGYYSAVHRHQAYRGRGEYLDQLRRYTSLLSRDQLYVMYSEDFFRDPRGEFSGLCSFLGIDPLETLEAKQYNARPSASMPAAARSRLSAHFAEGRGALEEFVGRPAPWPTGD
ncbi:sulfotransferase domain-containing protein [Serinicoccus kebangsaanensis]|uniref:sulfotransferase domain-containing protein n=1 Tax=Serinicoccus kebangsaanensis TaxID=2602069 RepID=UPI00124E949B|nr:sulfotransferase domain-containing protein [Serinicoccus kebangsaanensis]